MSRTDRMASDLSRTGPVERDIEQAITALKKDAYLLKYGRRGKPKFCPFLLSNPIFQRYPRPEKEYQSFSLIYNDRSLDLVWDIDTLQCSKTLNGHEDAVMSLLHCNGCLFSCSLDCSTKVWFAAEGENWKVIYTHMEEKGVLALYGMNGAETKPVLFCACNDKTVRLYDLPSFTERGRIWFTERGRIYSKEEVRVIY